MSVANHRQLLELDARCERRQISPLPHPGNITQAPELHTAAQGVDGEQAAAAAEVDRSERR
jgi:hypothetical protein